MTTTTETPRLIYDVNTAKLLPGRFGVGKDHSDTKETIQSWVVVAFDPKAKRGERIRECVTVRWFMSRSKNASGVYCSLWAKPREHGTDWHAGSGSAEGGGYHKCSAALSTALGRAGIKMEGSCHGAGDGAMEAALYAVARALGYRSEITIVKG